MSESKAAIITGASSGMGLEYSRQLAARILDWTDSTGLKPSLLIKNAGMYFMEYLSADNLPKASIIASLGLN